MRKSAEQMARTYGQLVGDLILQRRMAAGWTQLELALEAFEDETKVRRVVELENGQVARPQARNLGPICETLNITAQDLARCKAEASDSRQQSDQDIEALRIERGSLSSALDEVQKLKRDQLETLAIRFEMPSPHLQTEASLRSFLELKAEEYRAYRVQIDALDERIAGLGNLKAAAQGAAERLDFDQVEELLSRVHEVEADIAAKTAEARAANALLRGQVEQAYRLLSAAADSFAGIDPLEPARRRHGYMKQLFYHGLRYGGPGVALSARMTQDALADLPQATDPALWARLQNNLAVALKEQGSRTEGAAGAALLGQAVDAYCAALEVRTRADHPVDWAGTTQNLAIALRNQGSRTGGAAGAALLGQAVDAYGAALEVYTRADHPVDWAATTQNLANALQEQGIRTEGAAGAALLGQAVDAYRDALEVRTRADHPVQWAMTQENMALLEQARAAHDTCTNPAPHLRAALDHATAALTVYDPDHMPYDHARATRLRDDLLAQLAAL